MAAKEENFGIRAFVYGSLKEGFGNHCVLDGARKLGEAVVAGDYKMLDLGYYPGVVRTGLDDTEIHGEVYLVSPDGLDALDCLEGHPSYYCREKIETEHGKAWIYLLPDSYNDSSAVEVETGIWTES